MKQQRICGMLLHAYYLRDPRVQREAQAIRDAGWLVKVICLNTGDEKDSEEIDGVRIIRSRMSRAKDRSRFRFILEYAKFMFNSLFMLWREDIRDRHDVVIVHNMPNALVFSTLPLRLRGCPVILDSHDAAPEVFATLFGIKSKFWRWLLLLEETLAMNYASALITVNRGMEAVFKERHPGLTFLLLHNSPSVEHLPEAAGTQFDAKGEFETVFHGHVHERNGVQRLVFGMKSLANKGINVRLAVHGDGPYCDELAQLVHELGLADAVSFNGTFQPKKLSEALAGKHLGIAPHYRDSLGDLLLPVKILEYTQAGIPVLCSRLATVEAYFSDEDIYYFETDEELIEKIEEICRDYPSALARVERARAVVRSIDWETDSAKLVGFLDSLCKTQ